MNNISGIKGLTYFLKGENLYQREILKFIESCKLQEDCDGYIKKEYTDLSLLNFISLTLDLLQIYFLN